MGIGSQKLMSFLLSTTALSDIVHAVADVFADALLTGEAEGFAIDATGVTATPAYVGAPEAGYISIKEYDSPAALMSNLPLDDPRSPLVQSGTSPKLVRYHSDNGDSPGSDYPLMRWTPHNLLRQSQTLNNAAWTAANATVSADTDVAPDGATTAETITAANIGVANARVSQSVTLVSGYVYTMSAYLKQGTNQYGGVNVYDGTSDFGALWDLSNGTFVGYRTGGGTEISNSITSVGSGWYRVSMTFAATNTTGSAQVLCVVDGTLDFSATQAGTETIKAWGAQLCRGYNANPYLVTTTAARIGIPVGYDTAAAKYGILVEPACTNIAFPSEDISAYDSGTPTIATNDTTAPDGATTADKFTGTTNSDQLLLAGHTLTDDFWTFSVYLKSSTQQWILLQIGDGGFGGGNRIRGWFDITNGIADNAATTGTAANASVAIENVGDGWYRCSVTGDTNAAANTNCYLLPVSSNAATSSNGASGGAFWAWGFQNEASAVATSYIPTLGSTVTRAKDNISADTTTFPLSATAGTMYVSGKLNETASGSNSPFVIDAGNLTDRHILQFHLYQCKVANVTQAQISAGSADTSAHKSAAAFAANDFEAYADGVSLGTDTAGTLPTVTALRLGATSTTTASHYIYQIIYLPRRMTGADMGVLTT
jgi:hypothetical protein